MPELPEVEVVRRGLAEHVLHRTITHVDVLHPRAIRRHVLGASDFAAQLRGVQLAAALRRGKYLWLPLSRAGAKPARALVAHLGMSGQLLVAAAGAPTHLHARVRVHLADDTELRFVDQRTFGGLSVVPLATGAIDDAGQPVPETVLHIARDPLDPGFDLAAVTVRLRKRRTGVKRALLDQTIVSGIGNIYADEALWRARLHYARPTETLNRTEIARLFAAVTEVMSDALAQGGTSFDQLYVNVNGQSGYFDRSLEVYGRGDRPCSRCGTPIRREPFMNRSSYFCPRCQPPPRRSRY